MDEVRVIEESLKITATREQYDACMSFLSGIEVNKPSREDIAMHTLTALLSIPVNSTYGNHLVNSTPEEAARDAVKYADALLKELDK